MTCSALAVPTGPPASHPPSTRPTHPTRPAWPAGRGPGSRASGAGRGRPPPPGRRAPPPAAAPAAARRRPCCGQEEAGGGRGEGRGGRGVPSARGRWPAGARRQQVVLPPGTYSAAFIALASDDRPLTRPPSMRSARMMSHTTHLPSELSIWRWVAAEGWREGVWVGGWAEQRQEGSTPAASGASRPPGRPAGMHGAAACRPCCPPFKVAGAGSGGRPHLCQGHGAAAPLAIPVGHQVVIGGGA